MGLLVTLKCFMHLQKEFCKHDGVLTWPILFITLSFIMRYLFFYYAISLIKIPYLYLRYYLGKVKSLTDHRHQSIC